MNKIIFAKFLFKKYMTKRVLGVRGSTYWLRLLETCTAFEFFFISNWREEERKRKKKKRSLGSGSINGVPLILRQQCFSSSCALLHLSVSFNYSRCCSPRLLYFPYSLFFFFSIYHFLLYIFFLCNLYLILEHPNFAPLTILTLTNTSSTHRVQYTIENHSHMLLFWEAEVADNFLWLKTFSILRV